MSDATLPKRELAGRRDRTGPARTAPRAGTRSSPVILLFLISLVIPMLFYVGPLRLSPYRVVLILCFIPLLVSWLSGRAGRVRLADISIVMLCLWYALAMFVLEAFGNALQATGIFFVETLGGYLLARCMIRTADDFYSMVKWFYWIVLGLFPFALYETLTAHNIILDYFGRIGITYNDVYKPPRWGLDRVQGPFEHPILFGVFCGGGLALSYYVLGYGKSFLGRIRRLLLVFFTASLSLSSGPMTSFVIQIGMIGWDVMLKRVKARWWVLLGLASLAWITISLLSNRSVPAVLMAHFAFNPLTAYYRLLIWDFGSSAVMNRPFFGIGLTGNWERPYWLGGSVDMYWLYWALQIGIPGAFFMILALFSTTIGIAFRKITDPRLRAYRLGFLVAMLGFFMAGWTVHYWNATHVLFMFLLGSGAWILDVPAAAAQAGGDPEAEADGRGRRRARRAGGRPERPGRGKRLRERRARRTGAENA